MKIRCQHKETGALGIICSELDAHADGKFPAQWGIYWTDSGKGLGHYYWNDKTNIEFTDMNNYIYIKRYTPKKDKIANKLLVIGILRKYFGFRFFWYINK